MIFKLIGINVMIFELIGCYLIKFKRDRAPL